MSDYPKTPQEWEDFERKVAQEAENEKSERLQRILVPGPEIKPADTALNADFLDRPNLKIHEYKPMSPGGVALPGAPCAWSDTFHGEKCGQVAHFMIADPFTGKGAVLCKQHTLQAAKERAAKAESTVAALHAKRAEKNLRKILQREGQEKP